MIQACFEDEKKVKALRTKADAYPKIILAVIVVVTVIINNTIIITSWFPCRQCLPIAIHPTHTPADKRDVLPISLPLLNSPQFSLL